MRPDRRKWLKAAAGAAAVAASAKAGAQPLLRAPGQELMPPPRGKRVVVLGGGWGGLTAARYLRREAPDTEVVVLERNPVFWSCPMSNKWLIDVVDTTFLVHDYLTPARRYGYTFVQTEVTAVDRERRRVHTASGHIDYDFLVVAAGIRYNYEAWFGNDARAIDYTLRSFPSAYIPSVEHVTLKRKIRDFKGGTLVMTLPPPPHRCPPSPYERACLIAWHLKSNRIPGKIVILDPKPRIAPITLGFETAFRELYPDIITHVPNAAVKEVDPFARVVKTAAGDFRFDDAILMSPHQAGDLAWKADVIGRAPDGRPTGWADVHPTMLHAKTDDRVYVIGDAVGAVSPQFGHYPKSGHVANRHARIVAKYIATRLAGQEVKPSLPDNLCYMLVNGKPREAIAVQFDYTIRDDGVIVQKQIDDNDRREELLQEDFRWAKLMYEDFLLG
jgi:NADPH-dependent 2,4-dienoyl-CoA reductase/sulfur reductase-like enzyme